MPFGLTNAPATFHKLMNQVVARMKQKPTVQALLNKGAVIEVYIGDVLLGTDDADDHLHLMEDFLALLRNAIRAGSWKNLNSCRRKLNIRVLKLDGESGDL